MTVECLAQCLHGSCHHADDVNEIKHHPRIAMVLIL